LVGVSVKEQITFDKTKQTLITMNTQLNTDQSFLLFQEGGIDYAINTYKILEVVCHPLVLLPTPLPDSRGNIYFRNRIIPVFPDHPSPETDQLKSKGKSFIILQLSTTYQRFWLSMMADEIKSVITIAANNIFSTNEWPMINAPYFSNQLFFNNNKPIYVINPYQFVRTQTEASTHEFESENQPININ
jgi:chemotaxis signal transduction protein